MFHQHQPEDEKHHHHHQISGKEVHKMYYWVIGLNITYVLVELFFGFKFNSLSLISDAGHNFGDVFGLIISIISFKLAEIKPSKKYTYGYSKITILAGLANVILLSIAVGSIIFAALNRFNNPIPIEGKMVAIIALLGIFINGLSTFLIFKFVEYDINTKGAYLHMFSDTLVSVGVVVGGLVLYFKPSWNFIDPLISIIVALVIIWSLIRLFKSTIRLSLDGVPDNIKIDLIENIKDENNKVLNIHHIHVWPISSTKNALTAHVLVQQINTFEELEYLKKEIKSKLKDLGINHATLEFEQNKV